AMAREYVRGVTVRADARPARRSRAGANTWPAWSAQLEGRSDGRRHARRVLHGAEVREVRVPLEATVGQALDDAGRELGRALAVAAGRHGRRAPHPVEMVERRVADA